MARAFSRNTDKKVVVNTGEGVDRYCGELLAEGWTELSGADLAAAVACATRNALTAAVAEHLDALARGRNYDNIRSAALRCAYSGPFQAEGLAYAQWMDACWSLCIQVLAAVEAGRKFDSTWADVIPTEAELLAKLPVAVLP